MSQFSPPSEPGPLDDAYLNPPPTWPKVIGIISIVLGALGLTCGGCGAAIMVFFMPMLEQQMGEPLPPPMKLTGLQWGLAGVGLAMAVLLILAGVLTLMRRAEGRLAHLAYAIINVPLAITSTVLQLQQMNAMAQWAANNPDSKWAAGQGAPGSSAGGMVGMVFGLALGLGYPVFLLIWFGVVKRRIEDMTGGGPPPAA